MAQQTIAALRALMDSLEPIAMTLLAERDEIIAELADSHEAAAAAEDAWNVLILARERGYVVNNLDQHSWADNARSRWIERRKHLEARLAQLDEINAMGVFENLGRVINETINA